VLKERTANRSSILLKRRTKVVFGASRSTREGRQNASVVEVPHEQTRLF
jgi:hypothetical protein